MPRKNLKKFCVGRKWKWPHLSWIFIHYSNSSNSRTRNGNIYLFPDTYAFKISNFRTSNSSNNRSRLANEISEYSINKFDNLCSMTAVMTEKERELHPRNLEAKVLSTEKLLTDSRASSSNQAAKDSLAQCSRGKACGSSQKRKDILQVSEAELLSERLKILEEETKTMKQAFFRTMEERRNLVSEIYQQFRVIHHCLRLGNQFTGEVSSDRSLIAHPYKDNRSTGLSQVLCQHSSPCIVTRDHRANMLALQEAGEVMHVPSNR